MRGVTLFILIFLAILTVIGWISFATDEAVYSVSTYDSDIKQADDWVEEGLYQRAILKYKEAMTEKPTEELYQKMLDAYAKRYAEDDGIRSDYISSLKKAAGAYPKNADFSRALIDLYIENGDYSSAHKYILTSIKNGIEDSYILNLKNEVRYMYDLNYKSFADVDNISLSYYRVYNGTSWGLMETDAGVFVNYGYKYLSPVGDDDTLIYTNDTDSRLISGDGLVMGIFDFEVTEAGAYSEGLIPVLSEGGYKYYDDFAEEQFGAYDYAGTFQNGTAVVQKGGSWFTVDAEGNESDRKFADILTDDNGRYLIGPAVVAAEKTGDYGIYDEEFNRISSFSAEEMDICGSDGLIAFKSGGKWGFVDTEGNIVIKPQYEEAKSFSQGLAAVKADGKWGFINTENEPAIEYEFLEADYFNSDGSCMVKVENPQLESGVEWRLLILKLGIV